MPRGRLLAFVRHSLRRGVVFLDGHGRPESRLFPVVVGFYPASALLVLAALRRPLVAPALAASVAVAAAAFALSRRRSAHETASLAALAPLYAAAHGAGMWRGLSLLAGDRIRR
jgi:prepilin-type processing-associated H-X9-DG protein